MEKNNYISSIVLTLLAALFLITACVIWYKKDQTALGNELNVVNLNSEPVEIQFWDMPWGGKEYIETATGLVNKYNEQHGNIKVKYQSMTWNNWQNTFAVAVASKSTPDISTGGGYQAFQFYKLGAILTIDDVVADLKSSGSLEDFQGDSVEALKYDGHYIALPWNRDIRVIWFRKDLFDKAGLSAPQNWYELRTVLKELTGKDKYGMVMGGAMNNGLQFLISMLVNNGGGLFDNGKNVDIINARNRETLNFISDLAKDGLIDPASAGISDDDAERAFVSGKAAIYFGTPGIDDKYEELRGKVCVMDPIEGPHGDKGTIDWINNIMLYKNSRYPEESKEFLKWWSENQKELFTMGKMTALPVRASFAEDKYYKTNPNRAKIMDEYVITGRSMAANYDALFPELYEIERDAALRDAIQGLIMKKDPDTILNDMQNQIEGIMKMN